MSFGRTGNRVISQDETMNMPYDRITICRFDSGIYIRNENKTNTLIGSYSSVKNAEYVIDEIVTFGVNRTGAYCLPTDEEVNEKIKRKENENE